MFGKLNARSSFWNIISAIVLVLTSFAFSGTPHANAAVNCVTTPFDAANFSNPTTIDNEFLPLIPGTMLVLEGSANRGGGSQPHQVIFIVTDLTKIIDGVRTVVVFDRDIQDGQLAERELAFFAQDDEGNVWNLGEYPEEFEEGQISAPSTWIAGLDGAEGGIHMHGTPTVGGPRYSQGYVESIQFWDCAKVLRKNLTVEVPAGTFKHVLMTDEVSPFEPGSGHQRKYHAPGVGIVQIGAVGDPEAETLSMVRFTQLEQDDLREVRQAVLAMDARGYTISPDVYGQTIPIEYTPPGEAVLLSPSGSSTTATPAYAWNVVPGASWYYLWINRINPDGSHTNLHKQWYKASAVCNGSSCSFTPPVTLPAGNYRWWIQTWNEAGYGPWSTPLDFALP